MAVVGIERVYLGVVDENEKLLTDDRGFETGLIEVTDQMLGTASVNWQVSKNGEELDGNNKQLDYIKAMSTSSMDITFNDLPFDVQNKILGREKAGLGWTDSMTNTYAIVIAKSPTPDYKNYVYICQPKSVGTTKGKNLQTSTSKKTNRVTDDFSFEGNASSKCNDQPFLIVSSTESGFSEKALFDQMAEGQTLVTADKTSAATSSPSSSSSSSDGVTA